MLNFLARAALLHMGLAMVKTVMFAAVIVTGAATAMANSGFGQPLHLRHHAPHYICTGTPPEHDPEDLNQMRASVDAASRLALAIRLREYLASCRPVTHRSRHHLG